MDIELKIYKKIEYAFLTGHKIAICPYGFNGVIAENIIKKRFHQKPFALIDNIKSKKNSGQCICVKDIDFEEYKKNKVIILITAESKKISKEYEDYFKKSKIYFDSLYVPSIYEVDDYNEGDKEIMSILTQHTVDGYDYVRLGSKNDGGYVMLDDFDSISAAFSFGIANDVSWDMDISKRGIDVFMYDHTIAMLTEYNERFFYSKLGIGKEDNHVAKISSLETILRKTGHINDTNLILKMDIEGNEWDVIDSLSLELLVKFKQITVEFHDINDSFNKEIKIRVLRKLNKTHNCIWIHGNNYGFAYKNKKGIILPDVIEVTFARREDYKFTLTDSDISVFNAANDSEVSDFDMNTWKKEVVKK